MADSWIDPAAKAGPLLYVTAKQQVDIYAWPTLGRAGVLKGLQNASGACEDGSGNVWIAETYKQTLSEYAHGGTVPIATLHDPASYRSRAPSTNTTAILRWQTA
ncbi:MAG TPA: hypothetical protein VN936_01950 [Candidatus Acidoferrum sp.]|nr:hypothetical protein [Candidatus Acidoferrum sp.]